MQPFFSIVIPLYNKENSIEKTLKSVFNQSFNSYEVIVINDGSTDNSEKRVNALTDERLLLITTKNQGVSQARNLGIKNATGTIVAFLDADDYWFPNHLENLYHLYNSFPEAGLLAVNYQFYYSDKKIIQPVFDGIPTEKWSGIVRDFFKSSMTYRLAWTSAVAIPKFIFNKIGGFDDQITLGAGEDTDMWVRIAIHYPVAFSNEITAQYSMIAQNKISLSTTTKRKFARLDKFYEDEKENPSLKKFLDLYRIVYALKHKLASDETNFMYYYSQIDLKNCSVKSRILLSLPKFILKNLFWFSRFLHSNKLYLAFYTRLLKS